LYRDRWLTWARVEGATEAAAAETLKGLKPPDEKSAESIQGSTFLLTVTAENGA
jgi:hypothetical protein